MVAATRGSQLPDSDRGSGQMSALPVAVLGSGLVSAVGLTAAASCAAIRAKLSNPSRTRFIDSGGEWITAHRVPLGDAYRGCRKLAAMAALAIQDCLSGIDQRDWAHIPLLLCVAERERPGRIDGLDEELFAQIEAALGVGFAPQSLVIPHGRVSAATALMQARKLILEGAAPSVLVVASDSLLTGPTLSAYERNDRLLTPLNSNGFMPGEGAAALLIGAPADREYLELSGLGFATEPAHIDSERPLRGEGLAAAIKAALQEAGCELHQLDFRVTDVSGEQYYFKEAALAYGRVLRARKERFDLWQPAQCVGESGAMLGIATLVVAEAACRKAYAPGLGVLCHLANDAGQRAALVLHYRMNEAIGHSDGK